MKKLVLILIIIFSFVLVGCNERIEISGNVIKKEIVETSGLINSNVEYFVVIETSDKSRVLVEDEALYFKVDIDETVCFKISQYFKDSNDAIRYIYDLKVY